MTRDDIIRMAREAGVITSLFVLDGKDSGYFYLFERFANLIAAAEREACAVIAFNAKTYIEAANAIRARGNYEKLD